MDDAFDSCLMNHSFSACVGLGAAALLPTMNDEVTNTWRWVASPEVANAEADGTLVITTSVPKYKYLLTSTDHAWSFVLFKKI